MHKACLVQTSHYSLLHLIPYLPPAPAPCPHTGSWNLTFSPLHNDRTISIGKEKPSRYCESAVEIQGLYLQFTWNGHYALDVFMLLEGVTSLRSPLGEGSTSPPSPREFCYVCTPFLLLVFQLDRTAGRDAWKGLSHARFHVREEVFGTGWRQGRTCRGCFWGPCLQYVRASASFVLSVVVWMLFSSCLC